MNGAISYLPTDSGNSDPADPVCALGFYGTIGTHVANSASTFGCGTLISPTQILCARHTFPLVNGGWPSGYQAMTPGTEFAYVARFRRKTDNSVGSTAGGNASYHQVNIIGYTTPSPVADLCIATLETPVTHITPMPVYGDPAVAAAVILAGWGKDGATYDTGTQPGGVRLINKTVDTSDGSFASWSGAFSANIYDSGGALIYSDGGTWKLAGVITHTGSAVMFSRFEHNAQFQIPGFYTPAGEPTPVPESHIFSNDTNIESGAPTTDRSTQASLNIFYAFVMSAHNYKKAVFAGFTLPGGALTDVSLSLFVTGTTAASTVRVRRIRRSGTTHAATYNTFNGVPTSGDWGTAGAGNTSTDVYSSDEFTFVCPGGAAGTEQVITHANLLLMAQAAQADDGILRLLVESVDALAVDMVVHSVNAVDVNVRPFLNVENIPTTSRLQNVTYNDATVQTTVVGDGITARGVCWATTSNPTVSDSKTEDGSGEGEIVSRMTPLLASTLYYARAYTTNAGGTTTYSTQMSFTTPPNFDAQFDPRGAFQRGRQGMQGRR